MSRCCSAVARLRDSSAGSKVKVGRVILKPIGTIGHGTMLVACWRTVSSRRFTFRHGKSSGKYQTDAGIPVRFLPLERWCGLLEQFWLKRLSRQTRWTLYADERINTMAFMRSLRDALAEDSIDILYVQEYWSGNSITS